MDPRRFLDLTYKKTKKVLEMQFCVMMLWSIMNNVMDSLAHIPKILEMALKRKRSGVHMDPVGSLRVKYAQQCIREYT